MCMQCPKLGQLLVFWCAHRGSIGVRTGSHRPTEPRWDPDGIPFDAIGARDSHAPNPSEFRRGTSGVRRGYVGGTSGVRRSSNIRPPDNQTSFVSVSGLQPIKNSCSCPTAPATCQRPRATRQSSRENTGPWRTAKPQKTLAWRESSSLSFRKSFVADGPSLHRSYYNKTI